MESGEACCRRGAGRHDRRRMLATGKHIRKDAQTLHDAGKLLLRLLRDGYLNMAQQGVFGEVVHVEGAYIHDLRSLNSTTASPRGLHTTPGRATINHFRTFRVTGTIGKSFNEGHTGMPIPPHGLGPVCQILDIHRGDRMEYLVSVSTDQFGMTEYAKERSRADSPEAKANTNGRYEHHPYPHGKGKTIMIQHDVYQPASLQPPCTPSAAPKDSRRSIRYNRSRSNRMAIAHSRVRGWIPCWPHTNSVRDRYQELARTCGRPRGNGLYHGLPSCLLPAERPAARQDVYDAAEWSCLCGAYTERSVKGGGIPVEVPDFTRGRWNRINGYRHAVN